jgi:hypothetical protein
MRRKSKSKHASQRAADRGNVKRDSGAAAHSTNLRHVL